MGRSPTTGTRWRPTGAPRWYQDAKFGIFIHWGVYTVPAFGNEWYPRNMYLQGTPEFEHHVATYGPQAEFGYKDFIPPFTTERSTRDAVGAPVPAGGRAVRGAGRRAPRRVRDVRRGSHRVDAPPRWARSATSSASSSPRRSAASGSFRRVLATGPSTGGSSTAARGSTPTCRTPASPASTARPSREETQPRTRPFLEDWLLRTCEIIDRTARSSSGSTGGSSSPPSSRTCASSPPTTTTARAEWGARRGDQLQARRVRRPARRVFDVERGAAGRHPPAVLADRHLGVSKTRGAGSRTDYKTADDLVGDLVDIVARTARCCSTSARRPTARSRTGAGAAARASATGSRVNGEAIYGTRPWVDPGEGPTEGGRRARSSTARPRVHRRRTSGSPRRIDKMGEHVYAIAARTSRSPARCGSDRSGRISDCCWTRSRPSRSSATPSCCYLATDRGGARGRPDPGARGPSGGRDQSVPVAPPGAQAARLHPRLSDCEPQHRGSAFRRTSRSRGGEETTVAVSTGAPPGRSQTDVVIESIKSMLRDGTLKAGNRIPIERTLALQLGYHAVRCARPSGRSSPSACSKRDKVTAPMSQRWTRRRLLSPIGFYAELHGPSGALELLAVRRVLEAESVALAATRLQEAELAELESILARVDQMFAEPTDPDPERTIEADVEYHSLIARASGNPRSPASSTTCPAGPCARACGARTPTAAPSVRHTCSIGRSSRPSSLAIRHAPRSACPPICSMSRTSSPPTRPACRWRMPLRCVVRHGLLLRARP